jgi:hypothetical protein
MPALVASIASKLSLKHISTLEAIESIGSAVHRSIMDLPYRKMTSKNGMQFGPT